MRLEVIRFSSQESSTRGLLFDVTNGRKFLCYTLEDEYREEKVMHKTRIPPGTYKLRLRTSGGFHGRYKDRFAAIHKGMIEIMDVPNFTHILVHCGNTDEDTSGCLLLGSSQRSGFVGRSTAAYKNVYPLIAEAIAGGAEIKYIDFDEEEDKRHQGR
tara:strand:- start:10982 stop:11452 length:471 start_codon:yes stop_codon:yes gene_type:complete